MSNYPPGTGPGDPNAPWNEDPVEDCEECGGVYREDGHERIDDIVYCAAKCGFATEREIPDEWVFCPLCGEESLEHPRCPNDDMNGADLADARRSRAAEAAYERRREKEMFDK